jgi:hypothetical protein
VSISPSTGPMVNALSTQVAARSTTPTIAPV